MPIFLIPVSKTGFKMQIFMIDSNICESQHLVTLRDSILPKLMSGELDVSELDI